MAILEKIITITLNSRHITYFEKLGYTIPRKKNKYGQLTVPKGAKLTIKVEDLPHGSNIKLNKLCDFCGNKCEKPQTYYNILKYRDNEGKDCCDNCKGKKTANSRFNNVPKDKSLAVNYPLISMQWHPTLNDMLTPYDVTSGSNKIVWWICSEITCRHEWEATINSRTRENGANCPKCWNQRRSGENCHLWKGGITDLNHHLRGKLSKWKNDSKKQSNFRCVVTGDKKWDVIHHLYSFNKILQEFLNATQIEIKNRISEYELEELKFIEMTFLEIHNKYGLGVCLRNDVHDLYHHIYGDDNTPEQFKEFIFRYNKGEFN